LGPRKSGFGAVYGVFAGQRKFSVSHRERCVTPEVTGVVALHRRTKMSLTIMTSRSVVMTPRPRERVAWSGAERPSFMMARSGRVRHALRRLQGSGRCDHAAGAVERALAQFEGEQAVALERAG
jgi:hypothetical protein